MSLLFSFGFKSTKNNERGIISPLLFDVVYVYYCMSMLLNSRLCLLHLWSSAYPWGLRGNIVLLWVGMYGTPCVFLSVLLWLFCMSRRILVELWLDCRLAPEVRSRLQTGTNSSLSGFILCIPATNIGGGLGVLLVALSPPSWSSSVSVSNLFVVCGGGGFSH